MVIPNASAQRRTTTSKMAYKTTHKTKILEVAYDTGSFSKIPSKTSRDTASPDSTQWRADSNREQWRTGSDRGTAEDRL